MGSKESTFEKKAVKLFRKLPNSYWPDKTQVGSIRGLPDRVGCVNGRYVAVEFKKSMQEAMKHCDRLPLQLHTLNEIQMANGYSFMCYPENFEIVYGQLKQIAGNR